MIRIDNEKCNACGLCIKICHEYCLQLENDVLKVDYSFCSTCTQCIAICPTLAITWDDIKPERFDKALYPSHLQMAEFFMERRTIRDYSSRKIDRSILEEITSFAIYAPTHNFNLRAIVIDDTRIIEQIDVMIHRFSANIYKWIYKPEIIHFLIRRFAPNREFEYLKAKPKLEAAKQRGSAFRSKPPVIIMIIGDKRVPLTLESAQYALYNIDLYAQTKGLACRNLVGNQMVLNKNTKFRKELGLAREERIFGTMTVGYPAVHFRNKVFGKRINIQWNY